MHLLELRKLASSQPRRQQLKLLKHFATGDGLAFHGGPLPQLLDGGVKPSTNYSSAAQRTDVSDWGHNVPWPGYWNNGGVVAPANKIHAMLSGYGDGGPSLHSDKTVQLDRGSVPFVSLAAGQDSLRERVKQLGAKVLPTGVLPLLMNAKGRTASYPEEIRKRMMTAISGPKGRQAFGLNPL